MYLMIGKPHGLNKNLYCTYVKPLSFFSFRFWTNCVTFKLLISKNFDHKISHPRIPFIFYIFYTLFIELELRLEICCTFTVVKSQYKMTCIFVQSQCIKNSLCIDFEQKNICCIYFYLYLLYLYLLYLFFMLQVGTFGHADKKISTVFIWWEQ